MERLEGKLAILGKDMNLLPLGHLHRGNLVGPRPVVDCSHWAMPGVPDLFAKEVATALTSMKVNLKNEISNQVTAFEEQQMLMMQDMKSINKQLEIMLKHLKSQ